jgi:excisionase family DNA binding protein
MSAAELLTVDETADFLRTTPKAVYHMAERGQLPGIVRIGRRVLVRREDLRRYVGLLAESEPSSSPTKDR